MELELLKEGYKRGLLPPDKKSMYEEAVRRGLVPGEKLSNDPVDRAVDKVRRGQVFDPREKERQTTPPADDPLKYRGDILPLGKTQSGKIVPAIPAPLYKGGEITKRAVETGQMPTAPEALGAASLGVGGGAGKVGQFERMSSDQLGVLKKRLYGASEQAGVGFTPQEFSGLIGNIDRELAKDTTGFHPELQKNSNTVLNILRKEADSGSPISLTKLDTLRKITRGVFRTSKREGNENEERIAQIIIDQIDDFIDKGSAAGTRGAEALKMAREVALRERKGEILDDIFEDAHLNAGNLTQSGMENALRNGFKKLAKSKNFGKFNKEEQEAITKAGSTDQGIQRFLIGWGNAFSPTAGALGKSTAAFAGIGGYEHDPLWLLLPATGFAARTAANAMRARAVQNVQDLVRGGSGMGDPRVMRNLRDSRRMGQFGRFGIMGSGGLLPPDFNPLINPNQT